MHSTVIVHADEGLDLYTELSRRVEIREDQQLLTGELGAISTVVIKSILFTTPAYGYGSVQFGRPKLLRRVNTPWYQQFDKLAKTKPKR
jgi:hypothetical protein